MITQDELKQIIIDYDFTNNTIRGLSKELSVSERTIRRYMRKLGIPPRRNIIINNIRDNLGRFCANNKMTKEKKRISLKPRYDTIKDKKRIPAKKYESGIENTLLFSVLDTW